MNNQKGGSMDYNIIKLTTLEVFQKCNIKSFPIDCTEVLEAYGMKVEPYSAQKPRKYEKCMSFSKDAFTLKKTVYYNDAQLPGRIYFSLAHEIAHIALKHSEPRTPMHEKEADTFASYFIAPRIAIHYAACKNYVHVAKLFDISFEAAHYAFNDYRRWHRKSIHTLDALDKTIYNHFYNKEYNGFVYRIANCHFCGQELYNTEEPHCKKCEKLFHSSNHYSSYSVHNDDFLIAESNWLYGEH